jgi:hypothetical protein
MVKLQQEIADKGDPLHHRRSNAFLFGRQWRKARKEFP